jgi:DNA-binding Lrp family transcriptional regulator
MIVFTERKEWIHRMPNILSYYVGGYVYLYLFRLLCSPELLLVMLAILATYWKEGINLVNAYITGKVEPGRESAVRKHALKLGHVGKVSIVYGDIDMIIEVDVNDLIELRQLNETIKRIDGVSKTTTYLVKKQA